MQDRVRELFSELQQSPEKSDFFVIDAGQSIQEVEDAIWSATIDVIRKVDVTNEPLGSVQPWS
jgi:thymidylate kinase